MKHKDGTQDKSHEITREEAVARMKKRIEEDRASSKPVRPSRLGIVSFWIAFIATPVILFGLLILFMGIIESFHGSILAGPFFLLPLALVLMPLVAVIVFATSGRGQIALGILAGVLLSIVLLLGTCFFVGLSD